ncbi:hypothetical protein [Heyndrickxia sporothermodurans]|uniref:hypothetical protein n=1 Tax=Heyndrickxia sporothermodurans TaxID=46224 RepID=UPI002E244AFA|nr:hypothetical protein [Heyndrickxia sporothermodurans]MED3697383.1 hypothetical protein [Heyndrickxia sporothermodurans]
MSTCLLFKCGSCYHEEIVPETSTRLDGRSCKKCGRHTTAVGLVDRPRVLATYKCLCCGFKDKVTGENEDYSEVKVCPKCNGAFVDIWKLEKYLNSNQSNSLLTIELESETAVPKVFYKGEEVKGKRNIFFDWDTDTDSFGGLTYAIEYVDSQAVKPGITRIERRVKGHATN